MLVTIKLFIVHDYYMNNHVFMHLFSALIFTKVLDATLMPSMLPIVKREEVTPMEVTSNLQSSGVFKVTYKRHFIFKLFVVVSSLHTCFL